MKNQISSLSLFSLLRIAPGQLVRFLAPVIVVIGASALQAAEIFHAGRSLQASTIIRESGPLTDSIIEDSDFAGLDKPVFTGSVEATFSGERNFASTAASMTATIDVGALKFGGTSSSRSDAQLNFDNNDIASGAFIAARGAAIYNLGFTIANSGTVKLSATLQANGFGSAATIQLEREIDYGSPFWVRAVSANSKDTFSEEIPLTKGTYFLTVIAGAGVSMNQVGPVIVAGTASFDFNGEIVEATITPLPTTPPQPVKPGKPRR
jgi:hypothetical protein